MVQTKSNRKTFLKGLGCTAVASLFFIRKKNSAEADPNEPQSKPVKLPLVARKAPKAVARENRLI